MLLLLHSFDLFFCDYMLSWGFLCGYFSFEYLKDTFLMLSVYNFKTSSYCNVCVTLPQFFSSCQKSITYSINE